MSPIPRYQGQRPACAAIRPKVPHDRVGAVEHDGDLLTGEIELAPSENMACESAKNGWVVSKLQLVDSESVDVRVEHPARLS